MNHLHRRFSKIKAKLFQRVESLYTSNRFVWIIIGLGIILRLVQFLHNRSLFIDESFLALNISNRSFLDLLPPLEYDQAAPFGFLILERLSILAFENNEYALRLIPLLSGIISLFLFYVIAKKWIKPKAVPIALGLFVISNPLIYYSSTVKQYSSDITIALLLYLITIYIQSKRLTIPRIVFYGVVGAIVIWFSHSAVFVLGGVGLSLSLFCLSRREWRRIGRLLIAHLLWALSLGICYFVSLRDLATNEFLQTNPDYNFMPFPPLSFSDLIWFRDTFFKIFDKPVGLPLTGIAAFTFIAGVISMFSEKRERVFILISPIFLTLLASGLHKYPFNDRLLLFLVPAILLIIAEGIERIMEATKRNFNLIGVTLIVLLFLHPLLSAGHFLIEPYSKEEIKPVLSYLREHKQDGDLLYLYYASHSTFKYYSDKYGFNDSDYIKGVISRDNWSYYTKDLDKLRGNKRVWILFSHIYKQNGVDEEKFFLYHLDKIGKRLDSFKSIDAAVYLYDLSEEAIKTGS